MTPTLLSTASKWGSNRTGLIWSEPRLDLRAPPRLTGPEWKSRRRVWGKKVIMLGSY